MRVARYLLPALVFLSGCGQQSPSTNTPSKPLNGQALATVNCARCHTAPNPAQLPPEEWPYLLAWMGNYLGYRADIPIDSRLVATNFVPPQPLVTRDEFDAIRNYFLTQSAVDYVPPPLLPNPPVSPVFEPVPLPLTNSYVSMVAFDPTPGVILVGTYHPTSLLVLSNGIPTAFAVPSEPVTFERLGPIRRVALMGHLGYNAGVGQIVDYNTSDRTQKTVADHLPRVADHVTADIDGDGHDDLVVCGFGDYPYGRVSIFWGGTDKPQEQVLLEEPGAVWCDVADLDGNGKKDIIVTIANNKPRIIAFVNQGGRRFVQRTIEERPVGWGYNRCLLVDWDGDGRKDIVALSGNNLELRGRPLKSWHGIHVLHNDGGWHFHEILFEPLPGAMDVAAGDFDGNGRVDLAVTAFCPDWRNPFPTTFLLLLQQPDGSVQRATIDNQYWNRWMRVTAADVDKDGHTDLLLGAAEAESGIPQEYASHYHELIKGKPTVLLLHNRTSH